MREYTYRADPSLRTRPATVVPRWAPVAVFLLFSVLTATAGEWLPIAKDEIHDPRSPAAKLLQEPAEALSILAPDTPGTGNQVRWVEALDKGQIKPRQSLDPNRPIRKRDTDVIMNAKGGMPAVRFPHRQHTDIIDCSTCHDAVFKEQAGATGISMLLILEGEQCGICHGAVSFPLTECTRCHSIGRPGEGKPRIPEGFDPVTHQRKRQDR
jgi:c(7)-type cytochrome triheme protein